MYNELIEAKSIFDFTWVAEVTPDELVAGDRKPKPLLATKKPSHKGESPGLLDADYMAEFPGLLDALVARGLHEKQVVDLLPVGAYGEWMPGDDNPECTFGEDGNCEREFELQLRALAWFMPVAANTPVGPVVGTWCLYRVRNVHDVFFYILTIYNPHDESPTEFYYPFAVVN